MEKLPEEEEMQIGRGAQPDNVIPPRKC